MFPSLLHFIVRNLERELACHKLPLYSYRCGNENRIARLLFFPGWGKGWFGPGSSGRLRASGKLRHSVGREGGSMQDELETEHVDKQRRGRRISSLADSRHSKHRRG